MSDIPPLLAASPASVAGAGNVGKSNSADTGKGSELTAGNGTVVLLAWIAASAVGSVAVTVFWGMRYQGLSFGWNAHAIHPIMALWEAAVGALVGGATMVFMSRITFRRRVHDRSPIGGAWVWGRPSQILFGFAIGILVSQGGRAVGEVLKAIGVPPTSGPVAKMIASPGVPQTVWLLHLLLLAPLFEELLCRGVLYGSYRRSLGATKAAICTTLIFTFMHSDQIIWFPPNAILIAGYALAALWIRLRTAAIGPAIAAHFAINLAVVLRTTCWP